MNHISARLGDGIDHAARTPSVLGGIGAGKHGELPDRIDTEVDAEGASRALVGMIIDHEPIYHEHIRRRTASRNRHKHTATVRNVFSEIRVLAQPDEDSGLQCPQLQPVASIQRQLADGCLGHQSRHGRGGRIHLGRLPCHHELFLQDPNVQSKVHAQSRPNRQGDTAAHFLLKAGSGGSYFIRSRRNAGDVESAGGVRQRCPLGSRLQIFSGH